MDPLPLPLCEVADKGHSLMWARCPDCLASYRDRCLEKREALLCLRCGKVLKKYCQPNSLQISLAVVTASLIFLFMANISPIMVFDVLGNKQSNLIITGVVSLCSQGYWPIAVLVFISAIALPIVHLFSFWYLLGGCFFQRSWPRMDVALKLVDMFASWNLIPVFAVATMAAVVKLEQLGNVEWKSGAYWLACLAFSSLFAMYSFDRDGIVKKLNNHCHEVF